MNGHKEHQQDQHLQQDQQHHHQDQQEGQSSESLNEIKSKLRQSDCKKLFVFCNEKAGGQLGGQLIKLFKPIVEPEYKGQVFNMNTYRPDKVFTDYKDFLEDEAQEIKILVCGGDGTVTWVLSAYQQSNLKRDIPCAILPLGTGNDLSIAYKWGGTFHTQILHSPDLLMAYISDVFKASNMNLDSWSMKLKWPEGVAEQVDVKEFPKGSEIDEEGRVMHKKCFNYFSIGQDAHSCYNFDHVRASNPGIFINPNINKLCYGVQSVQTGWLFGTPALTSINRKVQLLVHDDKTDKMIDITKKIDKSILGIIILNLPNYAGGRDLWQVNEKNKQKVGFKPQDPQDNYLEVVAYRSTSDFAFIALGLKPAKRLAQTKAVRINIRGLSSKEKSKYPETYLQVDGEPWRLPVPTDANRKTPKRYKSMLRLKEAKFEQLEEHQITLDITYNRSFPMLSHKEEQKEPEHNGMPCFSGKKPHHESKNPKKQTWKQTTSASEEEAGDVFNKTKIQRQGDIEMQQQSQNNPKVQSNQLSQGDVVDETQVEHNKNSGTRAPTNNDFLIHKLSDDGRGEEDAKVSSAQNQGKGGQQIGKKSGQQGEGAGSSKGKQEMDQNSRQEAFQPESDQFYSMQDTQNGNQEEKRSKNMLENNSNGVSQQDAPNNGDRGSNRVNNKVKSPFNGQEQTNGMDHKVNNNNKNNNNSSNNNKNNNDYSNNRTQQKDYNGGDNVNPSLITNVKSLDNRDKQQIINNVLGNEQVEK